MYKNDLKQLKRFFFVSYLYVNNHAVHNSVADTLQNLTVGYLSWQKITKPNGLGIFLETAISYF
jgi:hypothetical protein